MNLDEALALADKLNRWMNAGGSAPEVKDLEDCIRSLVAELESTQTKVNLETYLSQLTEIDKLSAELSQARADIESYKNIINDMSEGLECLPGCDSYAHEEFCPVVNPAQCIKKQRADIEERDRRIAQMLRDAECHAAHMTTLRERCNGLEAALTKIMRLDLSIDTKEGVNEWGEAECFGKAQEIARAALARTGGEEQNGN